MITLYRVFTKLLRLIVLPWVVTGKRRKEGRALWNSKIIAQPETVWFHAASVGELETLWPVIIDLASQVKTGLKIQLALTVMSSSADSRLDQLKKTLTPMGAQIVLCGYAPWEGSWSAALKKVKPKLFVTTKYEAWPELWMSLTQQKIPLVIVSARVRRSLALSKAICRAFNSKLPKMVLLTENDEDFTAICSFFPHAQVEKVGDPRWDQAYSRSQKGSARAKELLQIIESGVRPYGMLAQIWLEDLKIWKDHLKTVMGSWFLVPHQINAENLAVIEKFLKGIGVSWKRTSTLKNYGHAGDSVFTHLLVDEMGFLAELYAGVDWVYVGGGFGQGVHSTIEPAIYGLPLSCGPAGIEKFPEIMKLRKLGQLQVVGSGNQLGDWLKFSRKTSSKQEWQAKAKEELGAATRICEILKSMLV